MKHVLTIAGSDCSGGAGIQADLKAFGAWGVYGMSVITALTAQNTLGVHSVRVMDPTFVEEQLMAIFSDIRVDAIKIGMLANEALIASVAKILRKHPVPNLVLDPVMISKSGHTLLAEEARQALIAELLPLATVITPNLPEAGALIGKTPQTLDQMIEAGENLCRRGAKAALIKGGHLTGNATDILVYPGGTVTYPGERMDTKHTHGTGCSLSSALAAILARGVPLREAVAKAKGYVAEGISQGLNIGQGWGPIHHYLRLWGLEGAPL